MTHTLIHTRCDSLTHHSTPAFLARSNKSTSTLNGEQTASSTIFCLHFLPLCLSLFNSGEDRRWWKHRLPAPRLSWWATLSVYLHPPPLHEHRRCHRRVWGQVGFKGWMTWHGSRSTQEGGWISQGPIHSYTHNGT